MFAPLTHSVGRYDASSHTIVTPGVIPAGSRIVADLRPARMTPAVTPS
jgi:hypothetical protein